MRNHGKKKNYCLIAALASLVAFSTMAASVMSGCGENSDEQKTTEVVHETRIETQIETKIETYTEVVTDAQGNTEYVEETKAVPVNNNADGNSKSSNNSANTGNSSSDKNSNSQQSSVIEKSETSKTTNNSSSKTDSGKTNNNKNNNNNSSKNNNSSSSKSDSSKSDDSNSKTLKIGGKTFNVGDTIVCTYHLTTPATLENYQAKIKYDSSKLTCKSARMSEPAKNGAMLNQKISGEISISGINIGDGYDYTSGGTFMTVVYEVTGGGSTSPSYKWEVACRASDSKNLIDKKGNPASGFKLTSSYTDSVSN